MLWGRILQVKPTDAQCTGRDEGAQSGQGSVGSVAMMTVSDCVLEGRVPDGGYSALKLAQSNFAFGSFNAVRLRRNQLAFPCLRVLN